MEIFSQFMQDLDAEGRYLVINAAANQLRYPNSHTHYFSWTLLLLFHQAKRVSPPPCLPDRRHAEHCTGIDAHGWSHLHVQADPAVHAWACQVTLCLVCALCVPAC